MHHWRPCLPHKCGIALIRHPCGCASIGMPQQDMRTEMSASKGAHVAIPWPPRVRYRCFHRYVKVPNAVPPSTSFSIPLFVPNLAVQAMQGESPGNRPRAMGIFKGSSEQGRRRCSRARAALRPRAAPSPVERPLRVVPHFGPVSYTISSTLRHIPRSGEQNWGGRDD